MKTSEVEFGFPVLGFTLDKDVWAFADRNTLTSCGPQTLRDRMQDGMELIDSDGQRWRVRSIRATGRATSWLQWMIDRLISTPQSRIEHDLERLAPVTLDEVVARVCQAMDTFPTDYSAQYPRDQVWKEQVETVRAVARISDIPEALGLDSFMAY